MRIVRKRSLKKHVFPFAGNGNKDGLFTVLLRDYGSDAAAVCMNRLAKLR